MTENRLEASFSLDFPSFNIDINISLNPSFTALFGPSGCGKTTLLKCISGIAQPDSGNIQFRDQILYASQKNIYISPDKRNIGHVFQDGRLFPHLSVEKNLLFSRIQKRRKNEGIGFDQVVETLGISSLLDRMPGSLSGGESQRVAIGRALLASPQLLLLDEPLAALDQPTKISILTAILQIHRDAALPIIYVSHDMATVLNFASDVLLMRDGKITAYGAPLEVLSDYFSTSLSKDDILQNVIQAKVVAADANAGLCTVSTNNKNLVLPFFNGQPGEIVYLDIPASEIILATEKPRGLSARNILQGRILAIQYMGKRIFVKVDAGIELQVEVVEKTLESLRLQQDLKVYLIIKATAFRKVT